MDETEKVIALYGKLIDELKESIDLMERGKFQMRSLENGTFVDVTESAIATSKQQIETLKKALAIFMRGRQ